MTSSYFLDVAAEFIRQKGTSWSERRTVAENWANAILDMPNRPVHPIVASPPRNVRTHKVLNLFSTHTLFEQMDRWDRLYLFHSEECVAPHPWFTILDNEVPVEMQEEYFSFLRFVTQRKFVDNVLLVASRVTMRLLLTAMVHTATYLCNAAPTADLRDTQRNTNRIIPLFSVEQQLDSSDEDRDSGGLVRPVDVLLETVCELLAVYWPLVRPGQGTVHETAAVSRANVVHQLASSDEEGRLVWIAKYLQFFESVKFLVARLLQFRRGRHWLIFWVAIRLVHDISGLQQAVVCEQGNDQLLVPVEDTVAESILSPAVGLEGVLDATSVALLRTYCQKLDGRSLDPEIESSFHSALGRDAGKHLDALHSLLRLETSQHPSAVYAINELTGVMMDTSWCRPVVAVLLEVVELVVHQTDVVAPWRAALVKWEQLFVEEQESRARLSGSEAACRHELNEALFLHMLEPDSMTVPPQDVPQSLDDILTVKFLFRTNTATAQPRQHAEEQERHEKAIAATPPWRAPIRETIVPEERVSEVRRHRKNSIARQHVITAMLMAGRNEQYHRCELERLERFHREKEGRTFHALLQRCYDHELAKIHDDCLQQRRVLELEADQAADWIRLVKQETFIRDFILAPSLATTVRQVSNRESCAAAWTSTRRVSLVKQIVQRSTEDVLIERHEKRYGLREAVARFAREEHAARGSVQQEQRHALECLLQVQVPEFVARQSLETVAAKALHAGVLLLTSEMATHTDFFQHSTAHHLLALVQLAPNAQSLLEEVSASDTTTERGPSIANSESDVLRATPWAVLDAEDEARERILSEQEFDFMNSGMPSLWTLLCEVVVPEDQMRSAIELDGLIGTLLTAESSARSRYEAIEHDEWGWSVEGSDQCLAIVEWNRASRLLSQTLAKESAIRADTVSVHDKELVALRQSFVRQQVEVRRADEQRLIAQAALHEQRCRTLGSAGLYLEACALLKSTRFSEEASRLHLIQEWLDERDTLEQLAHDCRLALPSSIAADQALPQFTMEPKAPRRPVSASTTASSFGQTEASSLTTFTQSKVPSRPLTAQLRSKVVSPLNVAWHAAAPPIPRPLTAGRIPTAYRDVHRSDSELADDL